jgi:cytochrome d ubiquinol oxidase subunit I
MTELIPSVTGDMAHGAAGWLGTVVAQPDLIAARQTQALSLAFHIVLVCFGVAFPALVLVMEGLWLRTGDPLYRAIARRWSRVMLVLFAVGVVSGTILSFEFGLLWPEFMARFGNVFGFAFALEGFSFFIEAIFIAIYVYGWDRLSARTHFLAGLPIIAAGIAGSLFVLSVNGWMNNPTGFDLVNGKAVNVRPLAALFNDQLWHTLVHMTFAAYMVVGFVTAGVYTHGWLRGRRDRFQRVALIVPLTVACLAAPAQIVIGDWAARQVADSQPTKLAAFEGLGHTQAGAPIHLLGWYRDGEVVGGIEIPRLLSLLARHDPSATVTGLDAVPPAERPPVNVVRVSFQLMVAIGTGLAALSALYLLTLWRRRRLPRSRWFWRAVLAAGPAAVIALWAGWTTTEVGRQPWIVYRLMHTSEAVTAASGAPYALAVLLVLYAALGVTTVSVLRRMSRQPLEVPAGPVAAEPLLDAQ